MNKNNLVELLQELDSFYKFSEFLPVDFRLEYTSKIESLRTKISELENLKSVPDKAKDNSADDSENKMEASFKEVTSHLIPHITKEGIYAANDESISEELKKMLELVDGKSSIFELYSSNMDKYKNFFEFASFLYQLEVEQYISFIKNKNTIPNRGWLKIGEILSNSNIVSQQDISNALSHQENKQDIFIGEAMMDLKIISDITLRDSLKIQRWIFKISEYSLFKN